jgi:hypothetical protein
MASRKYDPAGMRFEPVPPWHDEMVDAAPGIRVPAQFKVLLTHEDWPTSLCIYGGYSIETGPVLSGLRAVTPTVSLTDAEALLAATIDRGKLMAELAAFMTGVVGAVEIQSDLALLVLAAGEPQGDKRDWHAEFVANRARLWGEARNAIPPRRRRVVTAQHLAEVAGIYRAAVIRGEPPTVAVAERFTVSHSTAARWVGLARDAGTLGPAHGKRPGEATTEPTLTRRRATKR